MAFAVPLLFQTVLAQNIESSRADKEETVRRIEYDVAEAVGKNDFSVFEKVTTEDFVNITPGGVIQTREAALADMNSRAIKFSNLKLTNVKVRVYGNAAVATYVAEAKFSYKNEDIRGKFATTDVFVFRQGEWKIVSSHATKVVPKKSDAATGPSEKAN